MECRRIPITTDTIIYIGNPVNHTCQSQKAGLEEFLAVLTDRKNREVVLKMKRCPECGKIYLRTDKYQRWWCPLKNYSFIRTKTGRPPSESYIGTVQHTEREMEPVDWDKIYPTPAYLVRGLRHSCQGGGCSGR